MKIQIDLGTVDVEMQRSDGTWEKVDHCHTRIRVEKDTLSVDLKAVLTDDELLDVKHTMNAPGANAIAVQKGGVGFRTIYPHTADRLVIGAAVHGKGDHIGTRDVIIDEVSTIKPLSMATRLKLESCGYGKHGRSALVFIPPLGDDIEHQPV